jgi:Na+-translocating ferredoxin:NAD+ oxidoreductase subunit A
MELILIFVSAALVNNFILTYFLGICPFVGMSKRVETAISMGMATTFVMTFAGALTWLINVHVLQRFSVPYLQYVAFILTIAALVQFVEMYIKKTSPALYRTLGIFLPLITSNCAVLGLALFHVLRGYGFIESVAFGFGAGVGFTLAMTLMASIREELRFSDLPRAMEGPAITLIVAGLLALAFSGFAGMLSV